MSQQYSADSSRASDSSHGHLSSTFPQVLNRQDTPISVGPVTYQQCVNLYTKGKRYIHHVLGYNKQGKRKLTKGNQLRGHSK